MPIRGRVSLPAVIEGSTTTTSCRQLQAQDAQSRGPCRYQRHVCRERGQASDFNAALDDHLQYLRRQKEAARMKAEYDAGASASDAEAGSSSGGPSGDLALKPGETIKVALPGSRVSLWEVSNEMQHTGPEDI